MISKSFYVFLKIWRRSLEVRLIDNHCPRERVQTARWVIPRILRASQRKIPPLKPNGAVGDTKYALFLVSSLMTSHKTPLTRSVILKMSISDCAWRISQAWYWEIA